MELRLRSRPISLGFIEPCLPTATTTPPSGPGWLHEIKHDGYRAMVLRAGDRVRVLTRNGIDWTARFSLIAIAAAALDVQSCIIDGEAIASGDDGVADFQRLRKRAPAILSAFDLLELDGKDMRRVPIEVRKAELARLLRRSAIGLELNEHIDDEDAARVFEHACRLGFEGIVSKRKGSRYQSGRSYDWLKMKNPNAPAAHREALIGKA
jgi:bifunctional non-homologous end joining protein LigD